MGDLRQTLREEIILTNEIEGLKEVAYDSELQAQESQQSEEHHQVHQELREETSLLEEKLDNTKREKRKQLIRVLLYIIVYLSILSPICYFTFDIPSTLVFKDSCKVRNRNVSDDNNMNINLDNNNNYNNNNDNNDDNNNQNCEEVFYHFWIHKWPWSEFIFWVATLFAGFTYVARVTESRRNPFLNDGSYKNFFKFMVSLPIVFLFGPVRTLYGPDDTPNQTISFYHNYFGFLVAFFLGLQFTYLDSVMFLRGVGDKFVTPSLWKKYNFYEVITLLFIVVGVVAAVVWHVFLIIANGLVIFYVVLYAAIILFFVGTTFVLRKTHHLHFHHYALFGVLIPLAAFPNYFSAVCLGLLTGIFVEGISRWSMAGFWDLGVERNL